MRLNKKLISMILALVMMLGIGATTPLAAEQSEYGKEIEVIKALGIMIGDESGNFNPGENLTRAEFAQILTVILKINDSESAKNNAWYFKTGDGVENQKLATENLQKFDDVLPEHWAYEVINQVTDIGYMVGTDNREFSPEEYVTINQVNKVLVNILGYEAFAVKNGGYPAGYNYTASSIKLLKGINHYGETPVLRGELAKMLVNMFGTEMVEISHITDGGTTTYQQSDKTFLEDKLGIYKDKGNMSATSVTGLYGESNVSEGEVEIGGKTYKVSAGVEYINNFIGKHVEFYYVKDDNDRNIIIYATLSDETDEFVIDIKDFVNIGGGKLKYTENDDTQELDIALMPVIIFNGTAQETITDEMLKEYSNGTITAIRTTGKGEYDMLVIEAYKTIFVKNIANGSIVNGLLKQGVDKDSVIDLNPENNKNRVISYYQEGSSATIKDIFANSVIDIAPSKGEVKVKITRNVVKTIVAGVSDDSDGYYIYDSEGKSYRAAKEFVESTVVALPEAGSEYELYFNSFGEVAYAKAITTEYPNTGLVIKVSEEGRGLIKGSKIRILNTTGRFDEYNLAEKVTYTNSADETVRLKSASEIYNVLSNLEEKLITFKTDENGDVSAVKVPVDYEGNQTREAGRYGVLYETNSEIQYASPNIDFRAYLTAETVVYSISSSVDVEEEIKYQVMTETEFAATPELKVSKFITYNKDKNSPEVDIVLAYNESNTSFRGHIRKVELFLVDKIKNATDAEGDNVVILEGSYIAGNNQAQAMARTYTSKCGAFSKMGSFIGGASKTYQVKKGDIIRCFEVRGDVKYAELVFRRDLDYAINGRYEKGAFAGINDGLMNTTGNSNPFAPRFSSSFELDGYTIYGATTYPNAASAKELRFADMYVLSANAEYITLTTQDLSAPSSVPDYYDSRYTIVTFKIPNYITMQSKKGDNYTTSTCMFTRIKTYEANLNDCSRAIVQMYNGSLAKLIILDEE